MEGIRMYKEKQKVGFGMNYTQSRELKENNRIYREMESIYHEICVKAGISDTDFIVLYSICLLYTSTDAVRAEIKAGSGNARCIGR